jgi:c-di-GMP-binding flagellar brake protein YcgR
MPENDAQNLPASPALERRRYPRVKTTIPLELRCAGNPAPLRTQTDEISLCGCYVETMFTLDVGAKLGLTLWLGGEKITATAVVATRYPQVGNGIEFVELAPEYRLKLSEYIREAEQESKRNS